VIKTTTPIRFSPFTHPKNTTKKSHDKTLPQICTLHLDY
jgi:hypothetical protein